MALAVAAFLLEDLQYDKFMSSFTVQAGLSWTAVDTARYVGLAMLSRRELECSLDGKRVLDHEYAQQRITMPVFWQGKSSFVGDL